MSENITEIVPLALVINNGVTNYRKGFLTEIDDYLTRSRLRGWFNPSVVEVVERAANDEANRS